jgi:hypothetical protein
MKGGEQNALSLRERDRERVEGRGGFLIPSPLVGEGQGERTRSIQEQISP